MAILYSLSARHSKPNDKNSEKKVYATAQAREVVDKTALAQHMSQHTSAFSQGELEGIITDVVNCIQEQLLEGNQVLLEPLGKFYLTLKSEGVDDASVFSAANIRAVRVRFKPQTRLKYNVLNNASFEFASTRTQQASAKKQEKQRINVKLAAQSGEGEGD